MTIMRSSSHGRVELGVQSSMYADGKASTHAGRRANLHAGRRANLRASRLEEGRTREWVGDAVNRDTGDQ